MMMSRRERTIALFAGVIIGALALDQIIIAPLWTRTVDADNGAAVAQLELDSARQTIAKRAVAERRWKQISGDSITYDAQTAEGQLLNLVPEWASEAGLSLRSTKPEQTQDQLGFGTISVQATFEGDLEAIARFLHAVQTAQVPVRVADARVNAQREGTDELLLQVTLSTIYRLPESPAVSLAEAR